MRAPRKKPEPWDFAIPTLAEARALRSLDEGKATPEQQKIALRWIMLGAGGGGKDVFVPGQPDAVAYLAGRRSVMLQIGWVLAQPVETFRKDGETDV